MILALAFSGELSGFPAVASSLILIALPFYLFVYLPIKLVTVVVAHANKKADRLRLLHQKTIVAEYDPPDHLTPAEMGFLFDSKLSLGEIFGTIVQLEQQGLLTITEQGGDMLVTTERPVPADLKKFEHFILDTVREQSGRPLTLKLLKKTRPLAEVVLKQQLQEAGYLATTKEQLKRSFHRLVFIMIMLMLLFPILAFRPHTGTGIIVTATFLLIASPAYFIFAAVLYSKYQKIAGEPWLGTPKLKLVWSDIEGYRHYIEVVEADNLKFDTETTRGIINNKALPYAIALGFNTGWLEKFQPKQ